MTDSNNTLHLPPPEYTASDDPLINLSAIRNRVDSLSNILSNSVNATTPISKTQSDSISAELTSAIHSIVINGAALITSSSSSSHGDGGDLEIVELDVMELTAEHSHTCQVCGKGFKRDANLRMHMRAHGDEYKTIQSLHNPDKVSDIYGRKTRFSCPYAGCIRNKRHEEFQPLKSVICVKNHFKRCHCRKKFSCNRCNKKRFSLLADLKSHMKHCTATEAATSAEETDKCKCSCGKMFLRKDELFEHMSLFEGHMPVAEEDDSNQFNVIEDQQDEFGFEFGLIEDYQFLQDMDLLL